MNKLFIVHSRPKSSSYGTESTIFFWAKHKKQMELYINKNYRTEIFDFIIQEVVDITDWKNDKWSQIERGLKIKRLKKKSKK